MPGTLIATANVVYENKSAYDAMYEVVNTFMDNNNGMAEFNALMITNDEDEAVSVFIKLTFIDITRTVYNTRMNQIQSASGLFPGATFECSFDETIVVNEP